MNDQWKPSLHIWLFKDAPEELRRLSLFGDGTEELIIYVPPELCSLFENGDWVMAMPPAFWFLSKPPKREGLRQYAGDDFGSYSLHTLPNGSRVAVTAGSEWNHSSI